MTHVVVLRARGGQDREVTNDERAQQLPSKRGRCRERALQHIGMAEKSSRYVKSREMCLCLKGEVPDLPFPQRGK